MDRKEFNMNEQIIINWTKTEESETLIINATINDVKIVKVVNVDNEADKTIVENIKNAIQNGNI
jgi:predicted AAA+ superfamily ATPase